MPPAANNDVSFVWSGDTVGQGYGINPEVGGMTIYEAMRKLEPDFFVHSGDTIYADGPLAAEKKLPDGKVWKNIVTEAKSKVAETLEEYRGVHRYNLLDDNLRRFNAEVPMLAQWDDHEVQQLVLGEAPRRRPALRREERGRAGGLRPARVPRIHAAVGRPRRRR